jgi:hypothetical protein
MVFLYSHTQGRSLLFFFFFLNKAIVLHCSSFRRRSAFFPFSLRHFLPTAAALPGRTARLARLTTLPSALHIPTTLIIAALVTAAVGRRTVLIRATT